jgi:hypothetical protein
MRTVWRAFRRQTFSSPRLTPLRRAASETLTPVSAMRDFSASLQRLRFEAPVITSTRR